MKKGQIVMYHCTPEEAEKFNNYYDTCPAIVTTAWVATPGCACNLKILF
jgi:hypothetical protein